MKEHNILPYDGHAVLIDDSVTDFEWPAITQALLETIPWRNETARIFDATGAHPQATRTPHHSAFSALIGQTSDARISPTSKTNAPLGLPGCMGSSVIGGLKVTARLGRSSCRMQISIRSSSSATA